MFFLFVGLGQSALKWLEPDEGEEPVEDKGEEQGEELGEEQGEGLRLGLLMWVSVGTILRICLRLSSQLGFGSWTDVLTQF